MIEERFIEIESKIAHQENMLDALNQTIYLQQKKIDELEMLCTALARKLKESQTADAERNPAHEKPPHY